VPVFADWQQVTAGAVNSLSIRRPGAGPRLMGCFLLNEPCVASPGAINPSVRNKLRQLRRQRNWTFRELSEASGVPLNTIWRMEAGGGATLRNALRVASAFHLSVHQIWDISTATRATGGRSGSNPSNTTLRDLRKQQGWRLYDLSQTSGVSITTLASVESGHVPTLENALRIADAFGLSVHEIWPGGRDDEPQRNEIFF
jgi:transcriptional regulator with XRE-family HTH domain